MADMGSGRAMGFIESVGLVSAITAADAALKAANVELIGRENSRGSGYITVKIVGDVGAVNAAITVAKTVSSSVARVWSTDVIPRPADGLGKTMVWNESTDGAREWLDSKGTSAASALPAKGSDSSLVNLPVREMAVIEDIPKSAEVPSENDEPPNDAEPVSAEDVTKLENLAVTEEKTPEIPAPPSDLGEQSSDGGESTSESADTKNINSGGARSPKKPNPPRRRQGGRGKKPK
jgi:microcompartment protein CcmL/EutN